MKRQFLVATALFLSFCSTNHPPGPAGAPPPGACLRPVPSPDVTCTGGGLVNPSAPIVCLDPNTLDANPQSVHAHRSVWIHFYLSDPCQNLDIDFGNAPVEYKGKAANEVWVRVKNQAAYGSYKYTATNLTNGHQKDPDIVIEP